VAKLWSRLLLWSSGVRLEASFETPLEPDDQYVFMANHQSLFDIPALLASLPVQTRFLAKQSLFRIPVFGWALKAGGFISIDRGNRARAREGLELAFQRLGAGVSALVYPEGTRSMDGRIGRIKKGGVLLALKSGLPMLPVGIDGSIEVQRKDRFHIRPGTIRVRYGRPIAVAGKSAEERDELASEVRQELARLANTTLAD
jgi:1-acyl-sn-glycerol-3-phosphate acyltransferase